MSLSVGVFVSAQLLALATSSANPLRTPIRSFLAVRKTRSNVVREEDWRRNGA